MVLVGVVIYQEEVLVLQEFIFLQWWNDCVEDCRTWKVQFFHLKRRIYFKSGIEDQLSRTFIPSFSICLMMKEEGGARAKGCQYQSLHAGVNTLNCYKDYCSAYS